MHSFAYQTLSWRGDLPRAATELSRLGFRAFESPDLVHWLSRRSELDELLDGHTVRPISAYLGGAWVDEEDREMELAVAEATCDLLHDYGCRHLVVGGGRVGAEGAGKERYEALAAMLEEIGMTALGRDIRVCYHPHAGTMVETPEQIAQIMDLTDPELVSLCVDVAHIARGGGQPQKVIEEHFERVKYVHLKDLDDSPRFAELGRGNLPLRTIVEYLREREFDGPIVIELDDADDPKASARRNRDYALSALGLSLEPDPRDP